VPPDYRSYGDLAWTEPLLAFPAESADGVRHFVRIIRDHSRIEARTLLHLGCGAGTFDHTFKKTFAVTGVDVSEEMLGLARKLNREVRYVRGDMRTVRLGERFDAVAIPDSIGYMTTRRDLRRALATADVHLRPGGVLLVVALVREDFRENNFVYTGSRGDVDLVVFENNHARGPRSTTYEATVVYLVRRKGRLEIVSEVHTQGLFPLAAWRALLRERRFRLGQRKLDHSYDPFLVGDGRYRVRIFACRKPGWPD
jgi:SAM-dependent methyltransferase